MAGLNLLFNALFQCFRIAYDAEKSAYRQVQVYQRFGLVAFEFGRVFRGRCSLYVLLTIFTPPDSQDFALLGSWL